VLNTLIQLLLLCGCNHVSRQVGQVHVSQQLLQAVGVGMSTPNVVHQVLHMRAC
jgi:hypothetical protein